MRRLQCGLLATVVAIGFTSIASAADMPTKAPVYKAAPVMVYDWGGFYIGGHVGGGRSSGDLRADYLPFPAFGNDPTLANYSATGVLGGVQGGYNWVFAPRWVLGVEGDYSRAGINSSTTVIGTYVGGAPSTTQPTTFSQNLTWLASARARLGYIMVPNVLGYVTGGAAWGGFDYNASYVNTTPGSNNWVAPFTATSSGYVVGGGVEWMLAPHWLLRGEYLFYHLQGKSNLATNPAFPGNPILFSWDATNTHVGRIAVSYKFN